MKLWLTPLIISCFLCTALWSQSTGTSNSQQKPFRVQVEAVNVLVTVHDEKTGKFITDLRPEDFIVTEDGVRQQIANFSKQTNLPLTIALCVDTSASVKIKLEFEKEAAADFIYSVMQQANDKALLLEFDSGVTLLHDFTSDPNDLISEMKSLRAGGGTSLYDAIYLVSEQKMLQETGRKTIVILSDGADVSSKHTFEQALQMAYKSEAATFAISTTRFGADIDHEGDNALKQLTEDTGGKAFFPYSTKDLTNAFEKLGQELRSQYNLTYIPTNKKKDGTFRDIKVQVRRDNVRVRYRKGYFAPLGQ